MVTLALFGLLAVLVAGALFLIAAFLLPAGEQIAPPIRDEPLWELPSERALSSADVAGVRLPVALRGYRFAETDLLLDRLADELRSRDEQLARLRGDGPDVDTVDADGAHEVWSRPDGPEGSALDDESDAGPEPAMVPSSEPDAVREPRVEPEVESDPPVTDRDHADDGR